MNSHSKASELAATLQQKQAQDRQQIEAATRSELTALANALKQQSTDALHTTLTAIESDLSQRLNEITKLVEDQTKPLSRYLAGLRGETKKLQALTLRAWIKPVATALSLFLGICAGSWGLTVWLSHSIQSQLETRDALTQQIEAQQQTLAKIEAQTWGVNFQADSTGRYLILPVGVEPATGYTVGKRQAVRLGKN